MYLNELRKNECAKIVSFECDIKLKSRLNSFGVTKNSIIKLIEETLSKNTIEIKINSTKIALRNQEASQIKVEKYKCVN